MLGNANLSFQELLEALIRESSRTGPVPPRPKVQRESSVIHHGKVIDWLDVRVVPEDTIIWSKTRSETFVRDETYFTEIGVPDWDSSCYDSNNEKDVAALGECFIVSVPTAWIPTYLEEYLRFAYKGNG